ncbi:uncharacterized protein LOC133533482 [Cydia pomonella]|uniref:uncharacterized protein LOC133533482 n=1 Tax=Cydia pomonella TaxID=82600 RepID=UPI002ADDE83A|nr:uncharacterized protein LOC133533482 [Cydia pomonella]
MPKPQYTQKFRDSWLRVPELKDWLQVVESTAGPVAKCKLCGTLLRNHFGDLKNHGLSKKHRRNSKIVTKQPKLAFKVESMGKKKEEARLALYTAAHTSIRVVDHLGDVINHTHKEDDKIHLHRTKCTQIIKNVLAPHFSQNLIEDLKDQSYSLLIDESTDIAVHKYLGIVIIYYSCTHKKIISTYLDIPMLYECDADGIVAAIKASLTRFGIPLKHLMGIGTDNAAVMVGVNNGVYAKLKRELPSLVLVRCICHSLQLAVSAATKEFLPRNLEFIIKKTYDWFSRSSSRQAAYKELYKLINDGHDPLKIVQSCQTRWLSVESAVARIYTQWLELKTHFNMAKLNERCYTAELLHAMYSDDVNYAYISFIYPILTNVNRVNKLFESKDADHSKLYDELTNLIDTLVDKIILPTQKVDIFTQNIQDFIDNKCYLGYRFETHLQTMKDKGLPPNQEEIIRNRCIQFIASLIQELKNRLPENLKLMKSIQKISVEHALSHNKEPITELMLHFNKKQEDIAKIDEQWHQIHLLSWKNTKNTKEFWYEVLKFEDIAGENRFQDLATFAVSLLVLPHSNADVERLFSMMNVVKTKQRNRMKFDLLSSIVTVRAGLAREGKCCNNYTLPNTVIQKIGTKEIYSSQTEQADETDSSDDDHF